MYDRQEVSPHDSLLAGSPFWSSNFSVASSRIAETQAETHFYRLVAGWKTLYMACVRLLIAENLFTMSQTFGATIGSVSER